MFPTKWRPLLELSLERPYRGVKSGRESGRGSCVLAETKACTSLSRVPWVYYTSCVSRIYPVSPASISSMHSPCISSRPRTSECSLLPSRGGWRTSPSDDTCPQQSACNSWAGWSPTQQVHRYSGCKEREDQSSVLNFKYIYSYNLHRYVHIHTAV